MGSPLPAFFFDPTLATSDYTFDLTTQLSDTAFLSPDHSSFSEIQAVQIQQSRRFRARTSVACLACRSRHLKCDARDPICSRCKLDGTTCQYTKSKRGGSGPNRTGAVQKRAVEKTEPPAARNNRGDVEGVGYGRSTPAFSGAPGGMEISSTFVNKVGLDLGSVHEIVSPPWSEAETGLLVGLYYENFHDAHPITPPKWYVTQRLERQLDAMSCLRPVLEYIGSIYTTASCSEQLRQQACNVLDSESLPSTAFTVQALLLFAIVQHCSDKYEIAERYIDKAIDIALSTGMNFRQFAEEHGEGDPVLEESWRRTWWMLYHTDALFAAISHYSTHRLQGILTDVDLPCEDLHYEKGVIPTPWTMKEYENRDFSDEEIVFSSFTYLIDTGCIISSLMSISHECSPDDSSLTAGDSRVLNWFLYLPKCKQDVIREDRTADETMFRAHLIINTVKLLLHRPHSLLVYSDIETRSKCTPPTEKRQTRALQRSVAVHTAKTLEAIEALIALFALPCSYAKHSPMYICALALAIMAQVSACNNVLRVGSLGFAASRERIRLGLGALKAGVDLWGLAGRSVKEVTSVARELLSITAPQATRPSPNENIPSFVDAMIAGDEYFAMDQQQEIQFDSFGNLV